MADVGCWEATATTHRANDGVGDRGWTGRCNQRSAFMIKDWKETGDR